MQSNPFPEIPVAVTPKPVSRSSTTAWTVWNVAATFLLYLGTIGTLPLLGKDEPRYVEVAREMWQRGDWVTPTLGGSTWFEKPALLYWLVMASFSAFGVSEWAARLGPALCGLATIGLIHWMTQRVQQKSEHDTQGLAQWSDLTLATCGGLIAFSHAATFDIVLTAAITLSLTCFFVAELESASQKRCWLLAGAWVGVGLSLLAKGLVGFILPGGIILLYLALRRDRHGLGRLKFLWGLPLALLVAALWYGPVIERHGEAFINEFFVQHHFARYLSDKYRHSQPLYYFVPVMALFALPWTAFLITSLREVKSSEWSEADAESKLRVFALSWLVVPVVFFSLSGSKLAGYVLPALPGAMLLVGMGVAAYVRGEGGIGRARVTGALLVLLGIGAAIYMYRSGLMTELGIVAAALPAVSAGIATLTIAHRRALCAGLIVGAILLSSVLLTDFVGVPLGEGKSVRALLRMADARGYHREAVWQMNTTQRTAEFYAAGRLLYDAKGEPKVFNDALEIARALPAQNAVLVLAPLRSVDQLLQSPKLQSETLGDNGAVALIRVRAANRGEGGQGSEGAR